MYNPGAITQGYDLCGDSPEESHLKVQFKLTYAVE